MGRCAFPSPNPLPARGEGHKAKPSPISVHPDPLALHPYTFVAPDLIRGPACVGLSELDPGSVAGVTVRAKGAPLLFYDPP